MLVMYIRRPLATGVRPRHTKHSSLTPNCSPYRLFSTVRSTHLIIITADKKQWLRPLIAIHTLHDIPVLHPHAVQDLDLTAVVIILLQNEGLIPGRQSYDNEGSAGPDDQASKHGYVYSFSAQTISTAGSASCFSMSTTTTTKWKAHAYLHHVSTADLSHQHNHINWPKD
ncbi:hypothetical protein ACFXTO_007932 [Malus domestica]